jgi:hypothetical protein
MEHVPASPGCPSTGSKRVSWGRLRCGGVHADRSACGAPGASAAPRGNPPVLGVLLNTFISIALTRCCESIALSNFSAGIAPDLQAAPESLWRCFVHSVAVCQTLVFGNCRVAKMLWRSVGALPLTVSIVADECSRAPRALRAERSLRLPGGGRETVWPWRPSNC